MRRLLALAVLLTACSPAQEQAWLRWFHRQPEAATQWAINECGPLCTDDWDRDGMVEPEPARDADPGSTDQPDHAGEADQPPTLAGSCSQWSDDALRVGWTADQWNSMLNWIMARESNCSPTAYNSSSGASGLLQLMQFWAADCGGSSSDLFDPWFNLSCGLHVYHQQGWSAWSVT